MFGTSSRIRSTLLVGLATIIGTLVAASNLVAAEEVSEQQIINALHSKPPTRGLSVAKDAAFIKALRRSPTRSLTLGDRPALAAVAEDRPKIDLPINFEYNSAVLSSESREQANRLGRVLSGAEFKNGFYLIAGYTDAKGSDSYNDGLSQRRAETVKQFLVEKFGLLPENLATHGFGKTHLKNPDDPLADENRRVQVVTMESQAASR